MLHLVLAAASWQGARPVASPRSLRSCAIRQCAVGPLPGSFVVPKVDEVAARLKKEADTGHVPFNPVAEADFVAETLFVARRHDANEGPYIQAVQEVAESLAPLFVREPHYFYLFKTMLEPERMIQFRVPWIDDKGRTRVNRGWRVQWSSALGPYKGGMRILRVLCTTAPASGETPFEPRPFCTAGAAPRKTKPSSSISSRPVLHVSCSPAEKPERRRRASIASVRALSVLSPRAFCE